MLQLELDYLPLLVSLSSFTHLFIYENTLSAELAYIRD